MIQWQHLFPKKILDRGREYSRGGAVSNLQRMGEVYTADVQGTDLYHVQIATRDNNIASMSCTCPAAADGDSCKHMAAVLYKINALDLKNIRTEFNSRREPSAVHPFEEAADAYRYYDMSRMTANLTFYEDIVRDARSFLTENECSGLVRLGFSNDYYSADEPVGYMRMTYTVRGYEQIAELSFKRDAVTDMCCRNYSCEAFPEGLITRGRHHRYPCKHMVAAMLLLEQYFKENNSGDGTNRSAQQLMDAFGKHVTLTDEPENGGEKTGRTITLQPRVICDPDDGLQLGFKIGTSEKQYILKSLRAFYQAVENRDKLALGKQMELDFSTDTIAEDSRIWSRMIRDYILDSESHDDYGGIAAGVNSMPLIGSRLDTLFDRMEDHEVACKTWDGSASVLRVSRGNPEIELTITKNTDSRGTFHGVDMTGTVPALLDGAHYTYCLDGNSLLRPDKDCKEVLAPLFRTAEDGRISMTIGRRNLTAFYQNVLPELRRYAKISEPDQADIEPYLPEELSFRFYLDSEDGTPLCRPQAVYGSRICSLSDWMEKAPVDSSRNGIKENAALEIVEKYFPDYLEDEKEFQSRADDDSVYAVMSDGVDALNAVGEIYCTDAFNSIHVHSRVPVKIGVSLDSDLMNLDISSDEISMKELLEILNSYKLKKKYHRLRNGDYISIDRNEAVAELSAMVDSMRISPKEFVTGKMNLPAYRALYLDKMLEQNDDIYIGRDKHYKSLIKDFKTVSDSDYDIPESLQDIMRPYQVYGSKWIRTVTGYGFGGILADDMGLGKTLQMISVLLAAREEGKIGTSLIVCPASLIYNWLDEFKKYAPELSACAVAGSQTERAAIIDTCSKWDVLVTSYDLLKRDCDRYEGRQFLFCVIDEAQYIKNHSTAAAKSVKIIRSRHRFALTGTPIENRLSELWSIFDFLMPGFLYEYETFRTELEQPIVKKKDEDAAARLRRMVAPFILRRLKEDVLKDLPAKTEEAHKVRLSDEQQQLYDAQVAHMKEMIGRQDEESFKKNKIAVLAELMRIRETCCDPSLVFENYTGTSAKREACLDLIRTASEGGHRMLVFSQFTSMLALLEQDLQKEDIDYCKITGSTPKQERLRLVNEFNAGDTPVFLISLKAGGTGLNLTGADIVIHYDPWWNAAAQNQATDRAHRIGQTKPVTVYKLIASGTVEEKIQQMQEQKLSLADDILSGETANLGSMTRDELLAIIS